MTSLLDTALAYHRAGLVVLPNDITQKYPAGLRAWQTHQTTEKEIRLWFGGANRHAIGVRDCEGLDFDNKGAPSADELYQSWVALVNKLAPGLVERLLCERTPSGGYHLVWLCEEIQGNQKLATRPPTAEELQKAPKLTAVSLIETRGKGGQFQVSPSPGYQLVRGDWCALPQITPVERQILLDCAKALTRADRRTLDTLGRHGGARAGDRYNADPVSADEALGLLIESGWSVAMERGEALYLTRPGKSTSWSATFGYVAPGVLYVFTSNAEPFQEGRAYNPFAILTELSYGGDYKAAARALHERYDKKPSKGRVNVLTGEILDGTQRPQEYVVDWRHQGITASQLYRMQFEPLLWTVENICPEGATLVAGKPKSRKSWAALGVAVANAQGALAFGKLAARSGRVLYLDLESNQRRMRGRLFSMVGQQMKDMDNLHIFTEWPRGDEGLQAIDAWMEAHPDTVTIVIDVLAEFRRPRDPKEDIYAYDRETVTPINRMAEKWRITILLIHHTRKAKSDDVFEEISGSTGLPSAVATMWVLGRAPNGSGETILALRGRDLINDEPLALEWDDYDNQFKIIGGAVEALQGGEKRAVLHILADDQEWEPRTIAAELKKSVNSVQLILKALLSEGLIGRVGRGKYVRVLGYTETQNTQNGKNGKIEKNTQIGDSVISPGTQNRSQNGLELQEAVDSPSVYSFIDSKGIEETTEDLFAADTPEGLTAAQWERARYTLAMGLWKQFADVSRESGVPYNALKQLVENLAKKEG